MLKDDSIFPFGKHKGEKLANVPASYLFWLKQEIEPKAPNKRTAFEAALITYIKENIDVLNKENGKRL